MLCRKYISKKYFLQTLKGCLEEIALRHDVNESFNYVPNRFYKFLVDHFCRKLLWETNQTVIKGGFLFILSVSEMKVVKYQMVQEIKDKLGKLELILILEDFLLFLHH